MNKKDILFRRALIAKEIRDSKAAELFSNGAWLPVMRQSSTYNSNIGYYSSKTNIQISGGEIIGFTLPGNVGIEGGHSYLVSVYLEGYTPFYNSSSKYNLEMLILDSTDDGGSGYFVPLWQIKGNESISNHMIHQYDAPSSIVNARDVKTWAAYSSTPFTMYSSLKKIS